MQGNNIFSDAPVSTGAVRNNGSIDIGNSSKRSSYSFTLSRVGMERELDDFVKRKTAKGSGLTISTYIRDLIHKDYNNQIFGGRVSHSGNTGFSEDAYKIIVDTKTNTDSIIDMLSSNNLMPASSSNNMFSSGVDANTTILLNEIYKCVSGGNSSSANYDIGKVLQIISDKLALLDLIERRLSSNTSGNSVDTLSKLDSMIKLIDTQNNKIDRLEGLIESGFESLANMLSNAKVINSEVSLDDEQEANDEQARIAALLSNDIEDDDE